MNKIPNQPTPNASESQRVSPPKVEGSDTLTPSQSAVSVIQTPELKTLQLLLLLGDHLWDWNLSTNEMIFSARFPSLLGYTEDVFSHRIDEWFKLIHPHDKKAALEKMRSCVEAEQDQFEDEYRLQRQDGSWQWVRVRGATIARTSKGRAARLQGLIRVIKPEEVTVSSAIQLSIPAPTRTSIASSPSLPAQLENQTPEDSAIHQKNLINNAENQDSNKEQNSEHNSEVPLLLSTFSQKLPDIVFFQLQRFPGGRCSFPYASEAVERLHGVTAEEIAHNAPALFDKVHLDDIDALRQQMKDSAVTLQVWNLHYRVVLAQGEKLLMGAAFPHRQSDDSVTWHGYLIDGSEHHAQIMHAQSLQQHVQTALASHHIGRFDIDVQTGRSHFSENLSALLKITPEYLQRKEEFWPFFWNECLHPDDVDSVKKTFVSHVKSYGKTAFQISCKVRSTDGGWHSLRVVASVLEWDTQAKAVRMVGTYVDVTEYTKQEIERRHLEDLLRSGRDRYKNLASELELLLTHTPVGIMLVHKEKILRANTTLATLFGFQNAKHMVGLSVLDLHQSEQSYQTLHESMRARLQQERFADVEVVLKKTDGALFNARLMGRILPQEQFSGASVWVIEEWQTAPLLSS